MGNIYCDCCDHVIAITKDKKITIKNKEGKETDTYRNRQWLCLECATDSDKREILETLETDSEAFPALKPILQRAKEAGNDNA